MDIPQPTPDHEWLLCLVGDWIMEGSCSMGDGQGEQLLRGTEKVRAIGSLWVQGESQAEMPGGGTATNLITLGHDIARGRFTGSFISSAMSMMWLYDGVREGDVLTLDCEGPDFTDPTRRLHYQDIVEMLPDGGRTLSSRVRMPDGQWQPIMRAAYRRI
ncbi:DUF1579 domain-containing protein [Falsiroseomonas stagni]|uniref:DUF1579 domain-containing protein n=1 Tax=Falsiroseomonas stagni DSM 19981 TaxID=1123062 RepID=A0A1I4E8X3_9PROT|nr:DUF1579 domain-containing protein [Falsiroseomonas stagni]SFL00816.1 Protein of unknown function [Falsiroseomonas stagni DSM 19981]